MPQNHINSQSLLKIPLPSNYIGKLFWNWFVSTKSKPGSFWQTMLYQMRPLSSYLDKIQRNMWGGMTKKKKTDFTPKSNILVVKFDQRWLISWFGNRVLFSFKVISKKVFFLLYYVFFAVQSESEICFLRSNL